MNVAVLTYTPISGPGIITEIALQSATSNWYRRKDLRSADYIAWEDAALQELIKKK